MDLGKINLLFMYMPSMRKFHPEIPVFSDVLWSVFFVVGVIAEVFVDLLEPDVKISWILTITVCGILSHFFRKDTNGIVHTQMLLLEPLSLFVHSFDNISWAFFKAYTIIHS